MRTELFAQYLPRRDGDRLSIVVDMKSGASDVLLKTAGENEAAKVPMRKRCAPRITSRR
jgi:hypothetical protein